MAATVDVTLTTVYQRRDRVVPFREAHGLLTTLVKSCIHTGSCASGYIDLARISLPSWKPSRSIYTVDDATRKKERGEKYNVINYGNETETKASNGIPCGRYIHSLVSDFI